MKWTPTEGMRRADAVVDQYAKDMEQAVAFVVPQIMRSRLFDLVAKALDQALADGSEQDAIAAVVGNGAAPHNERGAVPAWAMEVPHTADPVGVDLPDFPADLNPLTGLDVDTLKATDAAVDRAMAVVDLSELGERLAPKKKRGRPKGSKAKKKAKAPKTKADPAPVAENATTETAAPAEGAAS